jgi:hypothetical protein
VGLFNFRNRRAKLIDEQGRVLQGSLVEHSALLFPRKNILGFCNFDIQVI